MSDPRGFLKYSRLNQERDPIEERISKWGEFYRSISADHLTKQAARCMDCGVPFCQSIYGCPVENLIPDWNDFVFQNRWKEALTCLHSTNNFPEFTGKLCPAPCESACVLGVNSDPVSIRNIESSIIERGFQEGWVQPEISRVRTGKRVAIVGSGPAGLAAAQQLVRKGHSVIVFEKAPKAGGLLRYGIPEFKMEKNILDRRLHQMIQEGIEFRTGVEVGKDVSAHQLNKEFDALCLTVGAEVPRDLTIPGRDAKGIYQAMPYLTRQNRILEGVLDEDPLADARGKNVVILGGGDTGSDCLGTVHRQGCSSVVQFELLPEPPLKRSPETPWPLWPMQLRTSHAHEEGGTRQWSVATTEFLTKDGHVKAVQIQNVAFEKGCFTFVEGTESIVPADLVLLAIGFVGPCIEAIANQLDIHLDSRGNIKTDHEYKTNQVGIFSAGDARRGASLIVWAIAEGRKMADSVHRFLMG